VIISVNSLFILSFTHFSFKRNRNLSLGLTRRRFRFICLISPSCNTLFVSERTVPEQSNRPVHQRLILPQIGSQAKGFKQDCGPVSYVTTSNGGQ